ncbi:Cloroperoxidase [Decorospora gaudefroyi]|uniref:Cloroperoxidase n=1 Tax=Decorospora gaudefroyi TaxID=184978 RepID=A0A6A5K7S5_9PLEO|nr:Cloroperoxidase [Decorospora gaudefroyi]
MRISLSLAVLLGVGEASTPGSLWSWHPPTAKDSRGPCPMLNTLANHEFLPHTGRDFTQDDIVNALKTGLNFSDELGTFLFEQGLKTNTAENATTWGLDTLSTHNILEHDASLSRADHEYANDAVTFNATVFEQTSSYWTGDLINIQMAADARLARIVDSLKYNPEFSLSATGAQFGAGEGAAYLIVFGNRTEVTARKDVVRSFFENERLPTDMGWTIPSPAITIKELFEVKDAIIAATRFEVEGVEKMKRAHGILDKGF